MPNNKAFKLEKKWKEKIPLDILKILESCGFDTDDTLLSIDSEAIADIENYINDNLEVLIGTSYENIKCFKLKPGHKIFLQNLPNSFKLWIEESSNEEKKNSTSDNVQDFSYVLQTFIQTAQSNAGKRKQGFRYNEINRYFSIYIYLMCGKACYEVLSANLPMPQANTIRELLLHYFTFIKSILNIFE